MRREDEWQGVKRILSLSAFLTMERFRSPSADARSSGLGAPGIATFIQIGHRRLDLKKAFRRASGPVWTNLPASKGAVGSTRLLAWPRVRPPVQWLLCERRCQMRIRRRKKAPLVPHNDAQLLAAFKQ